MKGNRQTVVRLAAYAIVCIAILIVPLFTDNAYLLNKFARYIVFGILSLALSLSWGYAGILNLGQAVSFGLGSYCMAMALKLRTIPIQTGATGLPDFMVWNNVDTLPWFWEPFHSYSFAIFAGVAVPMVVAYLIAWFVFRARVNGVYIAIITLAMLVVINLLIIDQQKFTGGFNGITDLATLNLFGMDFDAYSAALYYLAAITLSLFLFLGLALISSKTGLILQAIRDDENSRLVLRVRCGCISDVHLLCFRRHRWLCRHALHAGDGIRIADLPERSDQSVHRHLVRSRRPRLFGRCGARRHLGHRRAGQSVGDPGVS